MLPHARNATSSFREFADLRDAVQSLEPMKSDQQTLARIGIDPDKLPNTTILSYADLLQRFAPGAMAVNGDLDAGIASCLAARDACRGWELNVANTSRVRTGNFWADFAFFFFLANFWVDFIFFFFLANFILSAFLDDC